MAQTPNDNTPAYLTIGDAKRVQAVVKDFERQPNSSAKLPKGRDSERQIHFGRVTQKILSYNTSTDELGIGKVKMMYRDPADRQLKFYDPEVIVDVENDIAGEVAVGKQVVFQEIDGVWIVMKAGC